MRLTVLFCALAALAQAQSKPPAAGLVPAWEMAPVFQEIGAHAGRLLPALNLLNTRSWVTKGASDTYVQQWESSFQQAQALEGEALALAKNPEKLSGALQLFFRLEGLENMLSSLQQGAAKYQTPEAAQSLASLYAEGGSSRERLRSYIVALAVDREHQFEVMDREAQRCRAGFMAAPAPQPCKAAPAKSSTQAIKRKK